MIITASCHYTSSAAMSCSPPTSAPATSTPQAHPRRAQAPGPAAPRRLARGEDHDPGRQRVLPLAADAVVRLARHRLRPGAGQEPGPGAGGAIEIERAERQFGRTGQPQRIFGSFSYAAGSWDRPRRVIVKAEHNAQGKNPRFVVTNVPGDPQELYEDVYCQRGEVENRIKEQQLDLFADRTSCHRFLANQFRLLLSSAAYVLVQALRRTALAGTELARAQVGTIRLKLFKVAARVVVGASGGVPPGEQLPVPGGVSARAACVMGGVPCPPPGSG